ncbi:MAG: hypothetical protein J6B87_01935 [Clostridia bacterium]|nr:hypothetical protein [Clostridia bacterium]
MERLIDITKFFIIKQDQFEQIIEELGVNLSVNNPNYLSSLIIVNVFAYGIIFLFMYVLLKLRKRIFRKRRYFRW